jgi:hypothetical protein
MTGPAPTYDELAQKVAELSQRIATLEHAQPTPPAAPITRRRVLRSAAATSIGAVAGVALAGMPAAHAAAGGPVVMGDPNDAGNSATSLASNSSTTVFTVSSDGASGDALKAVVTNGTGTAINALGNTASSTNPVVQSTATGSGYAMYAFAMGTGTAIAGRIAHSTNTASAIYGSTPGSGAGVEGKSGNGRGGKFTGRYAAVNLAPGTSTTHPSHGGITGDLYVDLNARLWFCRGSNVWVQIV